MKLSDIRLRGRGKQSELSEETGSELPAEKKTGGLITAITGPAPERKEGRLPVLPTAMQARPEMLTIIRIALAAALILISVLVKSLPDAAVLVLRIIAAAGVGFDIVWSTVNDLRGKVFSCDGLPVILAVILAFANGMSLEAAIAITVLQLALTLRGYAFCKTSGAMLSSISLPGTSGEFAVGDSFMLEGGQIAPADCKIVQGSITADLSFIYGKRTEKPMKTGDIMPAGCVALSGSALAEVTQLPEKSAASAHARAIGDGFDAVTRTERAVNRAANLLVPVLLAVSVILLIVMPLAFKLSFPESLRRVITIIAVASPCGVLTAIPLIYLASMTRLRRQNMVFLSAAALDSAAYVGTVVFEKTGTVTSELFEVAEVVSDRMDSATFLKIAAHAVAESGSLMARAVVAAFGEPVSAGLVSGFSEYPGWGVSVTVNGVSILLGTGSFMAGNRIRVPKDKGADCTLYMAVGGIHAGYISLTNSVNPQATDAIARMAQNGVDRIAMISGDSRERDSAIARFIGISEYYAECSDEEKARNIKEIRSRVDAKSTIAYVSSPEGSGKVCRSADIGIVINSFDVNALDGGAGALILGPMVEKLPEALLAGKRARRIAVECAIVGLIVKLTIAALAAAGVAPLWFGVLLDSCVSLALLIGSYSISRDGKNLK